MLRGVYMINIKCIEDYSDFHWYSDWNGYEVGYPEYDVIGLYSLPDTDIYMYVDTASGYIVEVWHEDED